MNTSRIEKAIVFDNQKMFAQGFSLLLQRINRFDTINAFCDKSETIDFIKTVHDDRIYLFADFLVPESNSISILNELKKLHPEAVVIIITALTNLNLLKSVLTVKPEGLLSKSAGIEEVEACLDLLEKGHTFISPYFEQLLTSQRSSQFDVRFTKREIEVLFQALIGKNIEEIGRTLGLSRHTVITHRRNMMIKANCNSITELLAFAVNAGIVSYEAK